MDEKMWLVCQMVPPLKVWGDSVSSDHISVILLFQTPKALVRFSTIQLLSKYNHLPQGSRKIRRKAVSPGSFH